MPSRREEKKNKDNAQAEKNVSCSKGSKTWNDGNFVNNKSKQNN
jgi:hypothetical protein